MPNSANVTNPGEIVQNKPVEEIPVSVLMDEQAELENVEPNLKSNPDLVMLNEVVVSSVSESVRVFENPE